MKRSAKKSETEERILQSALSLFRKRGFDETTMRDIADEAGVALGAAYYYFRGKNEIVHAYYERANEQQVVRVEKILASETDPKKRIAAVFHVSLDLLHRDRKIVTGLFRSVAEGDEVSPFGQGTAKFRARTIELFQQALGPLELPEQTRTLVASALWAAHMAMVLYMVNDRSKGFQKTRKLIDGTLDVLVPTLPALPMLGPTLQQLSRVLTEAGLLDAEASSSDGASERR